MYTVTKVAKNFPVGHCHVDTSLSWPYVKYNLNDINEKYRKRERVYINAKKK